MSQINYVTKEKLEQMREELQQLKTSGRAEIARAIAEAREKGDLKENAEYDAAKEAQGMHEAKVSVLESALANARVIDPSAIDTSKVSIQCKVKLTNLKTNKTVTYHIVSENEADLKAGKISVSSPIGKGLLGKHPGEIAKVQTPGGIIEFKIEEISI
jgi:transcription elongation factor GreA